MALGRNPEAEAVEHDVLEVPATLTIERIRESLGESSGVSIWDMNGFIEQLEQAGFSSRRHHVWLQSELARPLFFVAMVVTKLLLAWKVEVYLLYYFIQNWRGHVHYKILFFM